MNKGQGIQPVITALNDLKENKYDILVDTQNPELKAVRDERGVMLQVPSPRHGGESRLFGINPIAHAHIATANDIPKRYYDRMKTEHPDLLIENINEWLMTMKNKTKLVRTLHGSVRAIMSNGYRPLDVDQLFEAALPTVQALDLETRSIALTERNFYWKVVHKEMTGEIKVGKVMRAGAMIKGSDVGCSKAVGAMWWEETICTNGWVVEKTIDKVHIGARSHVENGHGSTEFFSDETRTMQDQTFMSEFKDTIKSLFNRKRFDEKIDVFREAAGQPITADPTKVVELVQKRHSFTDDERGSVLSHLVKSGDLSKFGLAAAITRTAEDLKDYDRSTEFEEIGTQVVETAPSEWNKLANN